MMDAQKALVWRGNNFGVVTTHPTYTLSSPWLHTSCPFPHPAHPARSPLDVFAIPTAHQYGILPKKYALVCCPVLHRFTPPAPTPLAGVLVCTACGADLWHTHQPSLVVICPSVRIPVSVPPVSTVLHHIAILTVCHQLHPQLTLDRGPFSFSFVQERIQLLVQFLLALPRPSVPSAHLPILVPGSPPPRTTDTISWWPA